MASLKTYRYENAGKMLEHTSRKHAQTRDEHIDTVRSYTNRMLSPERGMDDMQYLDKRIGEVAHTARKTLKVMGSWVVTVPKDILCEKTSMVDTFFDKVYDFMKERYGEINTVSCWVHYDEAVPHMHYNFVPVVYDEEQKQERINASKCIPYGTLGQFHWDMKDYLDRAMGFSVNVAVNAVRGEGDLTVLQLKIRTLKKEVGELEEKRDELLRAMEHCEEVSEINARQSEEGMILSRDDYESLLQAAKAYELYKPLLSEISSREKLSESLLADSMKDVSLAYELFGISQRRLFRELERKESELQVREVLEQSLKRELASSEEFLTDLRSSLTIDGDISYKQRLYNLMDILSGRNESLARSVSALGSLSEELLSQQREQLLSSFDREYEKLLTENSSLKAQNDILSELKSILTESGEDGSLGTFGDMSGYTDKAVSELEELLEEERRQYREIFEEEEPLSQREVIRI